MPIENEPLNDINATLGHIAYDAYIQASPPPPSREKEQDIGALISLLVKDLAHLADRHDLDFAQLIRDGQRGYVGDRMLYSPFGLDDPAELTAQAVAELGLAGTPTRGIITGIHLPSPRPLVYELRCVGDPHPLRVQAGQLQAIQPFPQVYAVKRLISDPINAEHLLIDQSARNRHSEQRGIPLTSHELSSVIRLRRELSHWAGIAPEALDQLLQPQIDSALDALNNVVAANSELSTAPYPNDPPRGQAGRTPGRAP